MNYYARLIYFPRAGLIWSLSWADISIVICTELFTLSIFTLRPLYRKRISFSSYLFITPLYPQPLLLPESHTSLHHECSRSLLVHDRPERAEELKWRFVQLHERNVFTQANPRPIAKCHAVLAIQFRLLLVFEPALRTELTGILAVDGSVAMYEPRIAGYFGTRRYEFAF